MSYARVRVLSFRSMLSAIAHTLQGDADQFFTMDSNDAVTRQWINELIPGIPEADCTPDIASTLAEYAADNGRVTGVLLESEAYLGFILAHYTDQGDIVRFVAVPA